MQLKVPLDEQETIISLFPAQVTTKAEIYTCMPAMIKRMKKLALKRPDAVRIMKEDEISVTAEVDRSCIKISPKRIMSEEQRQRSAEQEKEGGHMTAEEVAMKFASASATCKGSKCPFAAGCTGNYDTCKMKEVASILRFEVAELDQLSVVGLGKMSVAGNCCPAPVDVLPPPDRRDEA